MFALSAGQIVHLGPPRLQRSGVLALNAEEHEFGHVPEIEPHTASIRAAIFSDLVPDDVALVSESPRLHDFESPRQQCIGYPQVQMGGLLGDSRDGKGFDLL